MLGGRSKATGGGVGQTHLRAHGAMEGAGSCCWPPGGETCPTTLSCWGDLKFPRINAGTRARQAVARMFSAPQSRLAKASQLGARKQTPRFPYPGAPNEVQPEGGSAPPALGVTFDQTWPRSASAVAHLGRNTRGSRSPGQLQRWGDCDWTPETRPQGLRPPSLPDQREALSPRSAAYFRHRAAPGPRSGGSETLQRK